MMLHLMQEFSFLRSITTWLLSWSCRYKFFLHRHWNLYESMLYSSYIGSKLGLWKELGKDKLATLLVTIGLPVEEAKKQWSSMNGEIKKNLKHAIKNNATEFGLKDVFYPSFYKVWQFNGVTCNIEFELPTASFCCRCGVWNCCVAGEHRRIQRLGN